VPDHAEQLDYLKAALADRYRIDRELCQSVADDRLPVDRALSAQC
jgi:hypothetical protein